jgi:DNA-binding CsgD family transcriptional regulator
MPQLDTDTINHEAYLYAEGVFDSFSKLCAPLKHLNIHTLAYFRIFDNGRYLYLCNNLDWVRYCLQNVHDNDSTTLGQELSHVPHTGFHYFLWPTNPQDYLLSALHEHNIWNGLSVFRRRNDSIELWGFGTDRNNTEISNFYVQHTDLLKHFIESFGASGKDLINPTKDAKLAAYKNLIDQAPVYLDTKSAFDVDRFIASTPIFKHPLTVGNTDVYLNQQEAQCLNYMSTGMSAKEISRHVGLSHRSVEKYIQNMKKKTGCDKIKLIKAFRNSIEQWL